MTDLNAHNNERLAHLIAAIRTGHLVCVVGAGSSIGCGYPGWTDFLTSCEHLLNRDSARADEQPPLASLTERADWLASALGSRFAQLFATTFAPKPLRHANVPSWVSALLDLPLQMLATTNYSNELEISATLHPALPLGETVHAVKWHEHQQLARALRGIDGPSLLYLHGRYDDAPTLRTDDLGRRWSPIVLGETSYQYVYEFPGAIRAMLSALAQTSTLLVVGASLQDTDVLGPLRFVRALSSGTAPPHFVLLGHDGSHDPSRVAAASRQRFGLEPLFYQIARSAEGAEDHGDLTALLTRIVDAVHGAPPRSRPRHGATPSSRSLTRVQIVHALPIVPDFEPRPIYQRALAEFLHADTGGLLGLIGIGGAGKTSLVSNAINDLIADPTGSAVEGLFVWSFYDDPRPDAFLGALSTFLEAPPASAEESEADAFDRLKSAIAAAPPFVLVADGLEKVQLERQISGRLYGQLDHQLLKRVLAALAGTNTGTKTIVTSRFPLADFERPALGPHAQILRVESLSRAEARSLLRRRGVRGSDAELNAVIDYYGTHALTVDHLGHTIARYLDGQPQRAIEMLGEAPSKFQAGLTSARLTRLVTAYEGYLQRDEPLVRRTLEYVAIFTTSVPADRLLGLVRSGLWHSDSAVRTWDVQRSLERLTELGLIARDTRDETVTYSMHPVVREIVLTNMAQNRARIVGSVRREVEGKLAGRPRDLVADSTGWNLIEELIDYCIAAGEPDEAVALFYRRLGGFAELGLRGAEYVRGNRIATALVAGGAASDWEIGRDATMFFQSQGRLGEARALVQSHLGVWKPSDHAQLLFAVLSLKSGRLSDAIGVSEAVDSWGFWNDERPVDWTDIEYDENIASDTWLPDYLVQAEALNVWAAGAYLRGDVRRAIHLFVESAGFVQRGGGRRGWWLPRDSWDVLVCDLLLRCGLGVAAVREHTAVMLKEARAAESPECEMRALLTRAEAERQLNELSAARELVTQAKNWALRTGHRETMLAALLVSAKAAANAGDIAFAHAEIDEGLREARVGGYRIAEIDFSTLLARLTLAAGDRARARDAAQMALISATEDASNYWWGKSAARRCLAAIDADAPAMDVDGAALHPPRTPAEGTLVALLRCRE